MLTPASPACVVGGGIGSRAITSPLALMVASIDAVEATSSTSVNVVVIVAAMRVYR